MNIILYATGRRLNEWTRDGSLSSLLCANDIVIVAVCDNDARKHGSEIRIGENKYVVENFAECKSAYDFVVITSVMYYENICAELITAGYEEDKLVSLDEFMFPLLTNKLHIQKYIENRKGIEIGGPTDFFQYCYKHCKSCDGVNYSLRTVWWAGTGNYEYQGNVLGKIYIAEGTDLGAINERYDFVLSSNNLEHIANPIKAMQEFMRVLKPNGIILLVVPCKEYNFDHNREDTTFSHMLEDYQKGMQEDDLSHLPEILAKHDYSLDTACGGRDAFILRSQNNFENRCLHHHVFSVENLRQLSSFLNLEIMDLLKAAGNYVLIARKQAVSD